MGKSLRRSLALEVASARAAISASKTSACPPSPSFPDSILLPRR